MHLRSFSSPGPLKSSRTAYPHHRPSARTSRPPLRGTSSSYRGAASQWMGGRSSSTRVFMSRKACLPTCTGGNMSATTEAVPLASSSTNATQLDALIIGAGIAGMYQLYRLREQGLTVRGLEAGDDLGGTWYWNPYPPPRVPSQPPLSPYSFPPQLTHRTT